MYRDDVCPVCGESLPPDHLYCRAHAATVDERLHEVGTRLRRLVEDLDRAAELIDGIAEETWDYLAEAHPDDPLWPPRPRTAMTADGADVEVDVDAEPGMVSVSVTTELAATLRAVHAALVGADVTAMAEGASRAHGAGATH